MGELTIILVVIAFSVLNMLFEYKCFMIIAKGLDEVTEKLNTLTQKKAHKEKKS